MTENCPCPEQEKRHFEGFVYLLEALAGQGYAAMAINANAAYVNAFGEANTAMRIPRFFDLYMEPLADAVQGEADSFSVELTGRVDLSQLVLVDHSQGGAGEEAIMTTRAGQTAPADIISGLGPIAAAVLVAPAGTGDSDGRLTVPTAVILPACDRDLRRLDGQTYYERERLKADQKILVISVLLQWANHNRFNSTLPDEELANPSIACRSEALLESAEQREFLALYVPQFFDVALGRGGGTADLGLDAAQPAPNQLFGREVLTSLSLPSDQRLRLLLTSQDASGSAKAVNCPRAITEMGDRKEQCRYLNYSQPGSPEWLAISWNGNGGQYEATLPDGGHDLTAYQSIHLRAVIDPLSELNRPGGTQAFSLLLTDGSGHTSAAPLSNEPALTFPDGMPVTFEDRPDQLVWDNNVLLSSIRVPLTRFDGVDLADIQSIALVFDETESGAIFVTDLEFLQDKINDRRGQKPMNTKPDYVVQMEAAYGAPSQNGFGSAVFFERVERSEELEKAALDKYKYFVGELWERYGEEAWMGPWKEVIPARKAPGTILRLNYAASRMRMPRYRCR